MELIILTIACAAGYLAGRWHAKRIAAAEKTAQIEAAQRIQGGGGGGPLEPL